MDNQKCECESELARLDESIDNLRQSNYQLCGVLNRVLSRCQLAIFGLVCVVAYLLVQAYVV